MRLMIPFSSGSDAIEASVRDMDPFQISRYGLADGKLELDDINDRLSTSSWASPAG
jgi:hypothetical protein